MTTPNDRTHEITNVQDGVPIRSWTVGVPFEEMAREQVRRVASMPFVYKWVAVMPDVHAGLGATVGSVIPTLGAVIPSAVGVDIGCGMMAARTTLRASDLPNDRRSLRLAIERAVPHGRTNNGGRGDKGAWGTPPAEVREAWTALDPGYRSLISRYPKIDRGPAIEHLGTLGTGNHFIEICIDEEDQVWLMLHSGSRGVGNRIGSDFIALAKQEARRWYLKLPDPDLAYFPEGSERFVDYLQAVTWAQQYAATNRELMMRAVVRALAGCPQVPAFELVGEVVNCHHNYVAREHHYGRDVLVTRKGAVRARTGDLGIIPGSMGARSYITRGLGNPESFMSCSHGAGRAMSRTAAKKAFTLEDHARATAGVECRKDADVIDETPGAYKSIDAVMHAQRDLVEVLHTLRQIVCVKG
ncbi:MAG: RtcB family protein [Deltaproteobacteria bacterium]|nr:RtcB family protein [Deltaproteobacteria bacterium]